MWDSFGFFSSSVYRNELPGWVDKVEKASSDYFRSGSEHIPVFQTNNMVRDPGLNFVEKYFLNEAIYILDKQGYDIDAYNFFVSDMWGQIFNYNGYNYPHNHPNTQMSGLYFFSVPNDQKYSDVVIHDPRLHKIMVDLKLKNSANIEYSTTSITLNKVKAGTFLIFNSWLQHNLTQNLSNHPLKFLHFNLGYEIKK